MGRRLKILISAYACRPGEGSEPSIGWEMVRQAAQKHDVWVLTRANNRSGLDTELSQRPINGLHIIDIDLPEWARGWNRNQRAVQLHYYLWQIMAYSKARQLHQNIGFDLVHHVTYVKYWSPSFLSLLPIPFIWGPVGGGEECPPAFRQTFSKRGQRYEMLRNAARWLSEHDPFVVMTARRSAIARATTAETANRLHQLGVKTVQVYSQVGIASEQLAELSAGDVGKQANTTPSIRFLSVGRLLHWKGFHLGLEAFAAAKSHLPDSAEYWVIGDGSERKRLQALANDLGISKEVLFKGKLSRQETLRCVADCLALVHPSLHESGGMVCMEAMAAGCPVICLELGGPAVQVTANTGIKVSAISPEQTIHELQQAMITLATDLDLRQKLGALGRQHVKEKYCWDVKGENFAHLYQAIAEQSPQETGPTVQI
ncbi:MAG: glycosyltransferase family 4 protein [Cyanobacteria bacterium P01_C01_bin.120]